jgi:hypothetical protein
MGRREAISEDWLAVAIGLAIFVLSLGPLVGLDLLGFAAAPKTWIEPGHAVQPVGVSYATLGGPLALALTFGFVLLLLLAAAAPGANAVRFAATFTVVFWLGYLCWVLGNFAYIAVTTPTDMEKFGIGWSLKLTGESGYLIALILGLFIANVLPKFARWLIDAARPELFIKTAIVILGGTLGIKAAEQLGLASSVMFRGFAAIIEAYLIYWAVVYFVARKWFGFSREWAARSRQAFRSAACRRRLQPLQPFVRGPWSPSWYPRSSSSSRWSSC